MKKLSVLIFSLVLSSLSIIAVEVPSYLRCYNGSIIKGYSLPKTVGYISLAFPAENAIVPLLSDGQKAHLKMPREKRIPAYATREYRTNMQKNGYYPLTVNFKWNGSKQKYTLLISEQADLSYPIAIQVEDASAEVGNFMVGKDYYWKVVSDNSASGVASFRTENDTPRLVRIDGVPNVRDLGGYVGKDGRRVKQGLIYRTAGLNDNSRDRYVDLDFTLPENAKYKEMKEARMATVNRLRKMAYTLKGHAMRCTIGPKWNVFMPGTEYVNDDVFREFLALTSLPAQFKGAAPAIYTADAEGRVVLPMPTHDPGKYPAFLFQEFESPEEGVMQIGCGADWFWAISLNGETITDMIELGNAESAMSKNDHKIALPVKKGKNVLAVVLINGTVSWTWASGDLKMQEAVVPLLQGTYRPERDRAQRIGTKKDGRTIGKNRLNEEMIDYTTNLLGIKSDIDLRSAGECYGMKGSPMGDAATWFHYSSSAYAGMASDAGKEAFTNVFKVFLDKKNYPLVFHCIAGQDRTGAVACIINGLLGVEEEKLYLDWEVTGYWNPSHSFNHIRLFNKLIAVFQAYPGKDINEKIENYVLSLGFTKDEIDSFREFMLEK